MTLLQTFATPLLATMKAMMVATPVPITEMMSLQPVSALLMAPAVDHMVPFLLFFRNITEYH